MWTHMYCGLLTSMFGAGTYRVVLEDMEYGDSCQRCATVEID